VQFGHFPCHGHPAISTDDIEKIPEIAGNSMRAGENDDGSIIEPKLT
jgi:hypothetical protein